MGSFPFRRCLKRMEGALGCGWLRREWLEIQGKTVRELIMGYLGSGDDDNESRGAGLSEMS